MTTDIEFRPNKAIVEIESGSLDQKLRSKLTAKVTELGESLASQASSAAPRKTGTLAATIDSKTFVGNTSISAVIRPNAVNPNDAARYGYILAAGAKAHDILPRNTKALAFSLPGVGQVFAKAVRDPGFAADKFMSQVFEANESRIYEELKDAAKDILVETIEG